MVFSVNFWSMVLELPWTGHLTEIKSDRTSVGVVCESNLSLLPYKAQGVDNGFAEWVNVVRRIGSFLKEHPEDSKQYGWMMRSSCRNVLERINDRAVPKGERPEAHTGFIRDILQSWMNPVLVNAGEMEICLRNCSLRQALT